MKAFKAMNKHFHIIEYPELISTQSQAKELILQGIESWTVIQTERQSQGRGRLDRKWFSHENSLLFSVIFQPDFAFEFFTRINLLMTKALLECFADKNLAVKWPNDLMISTQECLKSSPKPAHHGEFYKVAGLLTEVVHLPNQSPFVVVGVGINLADPMDGFPTELSQIASGIYFESSGSQKNEFLKKIITNFQNHIHEVTDPKIMNECISLLKTRSIVLGRMVEVDDLQCCAVDIDINGALVVERDGVRKSVWAGDVTWIGK